jgi:prophage antirepressor-like protein
VESSFLEVFRFESHEVRVVLVDGEPWFVGKDVAEVLGYADTAKAVRDHCKGEPKRLPLSTPGGAQETRIISEPDLFRLVVNSRLPSAERFERWVFEEVLPTIRKTGGYAAPGSLAVLPASIQDLVSAILLIGEAMARVPGVKPEVMAAATLTCIQDNTRIPMENLRRALPHSLTTAQVGELLGVSEERANQLLAARGLQIRNERGEWELTEEGKKWGVAVPC